MPNALLEGARVLIAGVSARATAESAARAGYAVTSLDAFGDLDRHPSVRALAMQRDFGVPFTARSAADAAASIDVDAVAYLSPFENHPSALARLAQTRTLLGNSVSVVTRAREPRALAALCDLAALGDERWLLKPRASGGGHGIRWWSPGDVIPKGWYVQRYVEGAPSSIVFVAAGGQAVPLGLTRQLIGDQAFGTSGFRYCGSIAVIPSREATDRRLLDRGAGALFDSASRLAQAAARQIDLVGLNCIDFIDHNAVAVPLEINPRWSASMELVERAHGVSMFAAHADACSTGRLPTFDLAQATATHGATGKAILFARHDVVCGDTRAWLDDDTVRDVPHPNEHIPAGRPVCTVFATADDADACYRALVKRADRMYDVLESWASVPT